jgi:hypothetical protein
VLSEEALAKSPPSPPFPMPRAPQAAQASPPHSGLSLDGYGFATGAGGGGVSVDGAESASSRTASASSSSGSASAGAAFSAERARSIEGVLGAAAEDESGLAGLVRLIEEAVARAAGASALRGSVSPSLCAGAAAVPPDPPLQPAAAEELEAALSARYVRLAREEAKAARIATKQLAEAQEARAALLVEHDEGVASEVARHGEERAKMERQRQELREKLAPLRAKAAAARAAAANAVAGEGDSAGTGADGADAEAGEVAGAGVPVAGAAGSVAGGDSSAAAAAALASGTGAADGVGGGDHAEGGASGSSADGDESLLGLSSGAGSVNAGHHEGLSMRERHEEVLCSRRLDLLDQRQADEEARNASALREAAEKHEAQARRLLQREREIREAFGAKLDKGRAELAAAIAQLTRAAYQQAAEAAATAAPAAAVVAAAAAAAAAIPSKCPAREAAVAVLRRLPRRRCPQVARSLHHSWQDRTNHP